MSNPGTAPFEPNWRTCERDPSCVGMQVGGSESCLAHLSEDERRRVLSKLHPGADIDVCGTSFTEELLNVLLEAFNDREMRRPRIGQGKFDRAVFDGPAEFGRVIFERDARFGDVKFNHTVRFWGAEFRGNAEFDRAQFKEQATFTASFHGKAQFRETLFNGEAEFKEFDFGADALFAKAQFHKRASFLGRFGGTAWFAPDPMFREGAKFREVAYFAGAKFDGDALFGGDPILGARSAANRAPSTDRSRIQNLTRGATEFGDDALFEDAKFSGLARFQGIRFRGTARFRGTTFEKAASFNDCIFGGAAQFSVAKFAAYAGFPRATFEGDVRFDEAEFDKRADFSDVALVRDSLSLGPCIARELDISRLRAGAGLRVEWRVEHLEASNVHSEELNLQLDGSVYVNAPRVRSPAALTLIYHGTRITLKDAAFDMPTTISNPAMADDRAEVGIFSEPQVAPQLLSLQRVDATNLTLVGLDLGFCWFLDCYNRDRLRIEGPLRFADSPSGRRWTRRQVLAEEYHWRSQYDRHPKDWYSYDRPAPSGEDPVNSAVKKGKSQAGPEAARIQAIYRDLRKGREDAKDAPGAADFYYGEMEMRRFAAPPRSVERALLTAYWMIAGYGLRATRAVAALVLLLVLGTVGLATVGFAASMQVEYHPVTRSAAGDPVVYQQVSVPGARPGWAAALDHSLDSATSLLRGNAQLPLTPIGRALEISLRLLGPLLLGLAVLALRGRVKR